MATTLDTLQASLGVELFYYFKVTGIPHVFCCGINPYDSQYGASAWTLPAGVTAVGGMMAPSGSLSQSITDIIGGVATAERITIALADFITSDAGGPYTFISRLLSPGIATLAGNYFELAADIAATATTGSDVVVRSGTVTPSDDYYTFGDETIYINSWSAPDVNGNSTGQISGGRNRFPCSSTYPGVKSHRVVKNETGRGALGRNILVTKSGTPFTIIGRTAALYIGHMEGSRPCTEAESLRRLVGRIKAVDYGAVGSGGGQYEFQVESIVDDINGALVARGLGVARIMNNQIILPKDPTPGSGYRDGVAHPAWLSFVIGVDYVLGTGGPKDTVITIDDTGIVDSRWTLSGIIDRVNKAMVDAGFLDEWNNRAAMVLETVMGQDGRYHMAFRVTYETGIGFSLKSGASLRLSSEANGAFYSLLSALGFEMDEHGIAGHEEPVRNDTDTAWLPLSIVAKRPVPSVFIPSVDLHGQSSKFLIEGADGSSSQYFFSDQGDGKAYGRYGDGTVVEIEGVSTTEISVGRRVNSALVGGQAFNDLQRFEPGYYVPQGKSATFEQVILAGSQTEETDPGLMIGRLLASYDPSVAADDFNYYPDGVGLGWNNIIDKEAFSGISSLSASYPRFMLIDSTTKLDDVVNPICKELGVAILWDPETSLVTARSLRTPAAPSAHAFVLNESNRTSVDDRTGQRLDPSNIRTGWSLKWGYDYVEKKFSAPPITLLDNVALSAGVAEKLESLEDKTLVEGSALDGIEFLVSLVFSRSYIHRQPLIKCHRTLNRLGMTLAPGSYHQIVDNTVVNPFTGRVGVSSADALYALVTSIESDLATGLCAVDFLINRQHASSFFRKWSPSALLDVAAAFGGYDSATGIVTLARRYSSHATNKDGHDFFVGDTVTLIQRDAGETAYAFQQDTTITAKATDGSTVTVATGLGVPQGETLMLLRRYSSSSATRQTTVAYQGNGPDAIIDGVSGAQNHLWG